MKKLGSLVPSNGCIVVALPEKTAQSMPKHADVSPSTANPYLARTFETFPALIFPDWGASFWSAQNRTLISLLLLSYLDERQRQRWQQQQQRARR